MRFWEFFGKETRILRRWSDHILVLWALKGLTSVNQAANRAEGLPSSYLRATHPNKMKHARFHISHISTKRSHNILEPLIVHVFPRSLLAIWSSPFFSTLLPLHSSLPHSSIATYTYKGLGINSFHKDGVLSGSRMLWYMRIPSCTTLLIALVHLLIPCGLYAMGICSSYFLLIDVNGYNMQIEALSLVSNQKVCNNFCNETISNFYFPKLYMQWFIFWACVTCDDMVMEYL
jgi:hypothetical protein